MAPTYRTSSVGGDTAGTTDRSATITPAVDDLLVVFCHVSVNTNDTPTCSDDNGGGTYDRIAVAQTNTNTRRLSCFVRTALMVNTTSTTVTVATGSNTAGEIAIVAMAGMGRVGAAAVRQSATMDNGTGSQAPAGTFPANALTTNPTLGAVGNNSNPAGVTEPAGGLWIERQDTGQSVPTTGLEVITRDSGFTSTTITWGANGPSAFGAIIIELDHTTIVSADGAAAGVAADAVAGAAVWDGVGTSAGVAADTVAGVALWDGVASSAGAAAVDAPATAVWDGVGTSSGAAAASADGEDASGGVTIVEADGSSTGVAADAVVGAALWDTVGSSSGVSTVTALDAMFWAVVAASAGAASVNGVSGSTDQSVGASTGLATVLGVGANGAAGAAGVPLQTAFRAHRR